MVRLLKPFERNSFRFGRCWIEMLSSQPVGRQDLKHFALNLGD